MKGNDVFVGIHSICFTSLSVRKSVSSTGNEKRSDIPVPYLYQATGYKHCAHRLRVLVTSFHVSVVTKFNLSNPLNRRR